MNTTPGYVVSGEEGSGLEIKQQREVVIFDIIRMIFGVYNPVIPDSVIKEYEDDLDFRTDIIRCHWNTHIWALYWTCYLYEYLNNRSNMSDDKISESVLFSSKTGKRIKEILGPRVNEGEPLSFDEIL